MTELFQEGCFAAKALEDQLNIPVQQRMIKREMACEDVFWQRRKVVG